MSPNTTFNEKLAKDFNFLALCRKNIELLRMAENSGIILLGRDPKNIINKARGLLGNTFLHDAVLQGSIEKVEDLLGRGANVNVTNDNGATPLALAIEKGYFGIFQLLLEAKDFNVNAVCHGEGNTPLHLAVGYNRIAMTVKLLAKGADQHILNANKTTPFGIALKRNDSIMLKLLLKANEDINRNIVNYKMPPLGVIIGRGDIELVKFLLMEKKTPVNVIYSERSITPLFIAVQYNYLDIINLLFEQGATIQSKIIASTTTLIENAKKKNRLVQLNKLFKDYKVDIAKDEIYDFTELHAAAFFGHVEMVKILLKKGADSYCKTKEGISVLDLAEAMGNTEICAIIKKQLRSNILCYRDESDEISKLTSFFGLFSPSSSEQEQQDNFVNTEECNNPLLM